MQELSFRTVRGQDHPSEGRGLRADPAGMASLPSRTLVLCALCLALALGGCDRSGLYDGPSFTGGGGPLPVECPPQRTPSQLKAKISEVMVENVSVLEDEYGKYPPWLEIYNNSDEELDLGDVPLGDSLVSFDKWRIPCRAESKVPPRGYLVIFLDGGTEEEDDYHADIELVPGAQIQLVLNKGSDFFTFDGSELGPDQSAGRYPEDNAQIDVLSKATPGAPNEPAGSAAAPLEAKFVRGDANEDRRVNVTDMNRVLQVLFRSHPGPSCEDRLDADDDGKINVGDALFIGNTLFLPGPSFPPPYPEEGTDPTADEVPCPLR